MRVEAIVAVDQGWLIGAKGGMPWRLPDDFKHFKQTTLGSTVIMGRVTWESLPVRPLVGRVNVVMSSREGYEAPGAIVVKTPEQALAVARAQDDQPAMIIGGAQIYRVFMPWIERVYLTVVQARFEGEVYFPALEAQGWRVVASRDHEADARHAHPFTILTLDRVSAHPALAQVPAAWSAQPRELFVDEV